jgi:hypothetical protein
MNPIRYGIAQAQLYPQQRLSFAIGETDAGRLNGFLRPAFNKPGTEVT